MLLHCTLRGGALAALVLLGASCVDTPALTDVPEQPTTSPVKWVLIQPAVVQIAPGKSVSLHVELQDGAGRDLHGQPVQWNSADSSIATVDTTGKVIAKRTGTVHVTAASGHTSAYAEVTVTTAPPPTLYVSITPATTSVAVRSEVQLVARVTDTKGTLVPSAAVAWTSGNASVAAVDSSGAVTGIAVGVVTIKATAGTATATAQVTVYKDTVTSSPPPTSPPPPPSGSLFSGYSLTSPHWPHIRTMMTDFYYGWTSTERTWAGAHYDYAMSGNVTAWKQVNPTVTHLRYALLWTTRITTTDPLVATGYYTDMQAWYASHPQYQIENALLHVTGAATLDSASRLVVGNSDSPRWMINPGDAGARAYTVDRLARVSDGTDGVFIDESSSGDFLGKASKSAEYATSMDAYRTACTSLLAAIKLRLASKMLMLNTAQYTTAFDSVNAVTAGAVHLEKMNSALSSAMYHTWQWIDDLLAQGVFVDFVSAYSTAEMSHLSTTVPPGNSATTTQRMKLWELASYYMVVPSSPDRLALQLENLWSLPYSSIWTAAQEANIGHPTGSRTILSRGVDPLGQNYTLYSRDFDRALVLVRHQMGWGSQVYTDQTAITVPLPSGETWLPLHADGTLGAPVTSIQLRNAEAAILIKQSRIQ